MLKEFLFTVIIMSVIRGSSSTLPGLLCTLSLRVAFINSKECRIYSLK